MTNNRSGESMSEFTEEQAVKLAGWLSIEQDESGEWCVDEDMPLLPHELDKWLRSNDGLAFVETAMIGRGYRVIVALIDELQWGCKFQKENWPEIYLGNRVHEDKATAILAAAYKCMEAEHG